MNTPVVMSWSGGKDSAMALYEVRRSQQYDIVALLTSVSDEYRRISHHGVREMLLEEQADAIGIPLTRCISHRETITRVPMRRTSRSWAM